MRKLLFLTFVVLFFLVGCTGLVTVNGPEDATPTTVPADPIIQPIDNDDAADAATDEAPADPVNEATEPAPAGEVEAAEVSLDDNPGAMQVVTWDDVNDVLAETMEPSMVFANLLEAYWPFIISVSSEQIEEGVTVEGESVVFVELYYLGETLPNGVDWLCQQCHEFGWGLLTVDEGVEYTLPWSADAPVAGAWILPINQTLQRVQEDWLITTFDQRALPLISESAVRDELGALASPEQAISHMNETYWQVALGWTSQDADNGYAVVGPAIMWTAWHGSQPSGVVSACDNCTRKDWGVFYVPSGTSFEMPDNNSGGRWLPLWGSSCEGASRIQQFISSAESPQEAVGMMHGDLWSPVEQFAGYNRTENFVSGGVLDLAADEVALIWTDWKGSPPLGTMPATSGSYDFGYGVFTAAGPWEHQFSDGGGGAFVFSCD